MAEIERRTRSYRLPPMRWPDPWPADYLFAMRATTAAFALGLGRDFVLHAYRHAFQRGADLSMADRVLEAARHAGIDARVLETEAASPQIKRALRDATEAACELGVFGVPTIAIDDELFWGDDRLEDAAAHLRGVTAASG